MFPVILSILVMWLICAILTATDVFGENDAARTDLNGKIIEEIAWARFPYPRECLFSTKILKQVEDESARRMGHFLPAL